MYTQLTVEITGADGIAYTDRMHPGIQARICNLTIGWITLMIGDGEDDADRVKVLDRIIWSATILRDAAAARIAEVTCDHCGKPTIGKALCPDCLAIWNTEPVDAANGEAVA